MLLPAPGQQLLWLPPKVNEERTHKCTSQGASRRNLDEHTLCPTGHDSMRYMVQIRNPSGPGKAVNPRLVGTGT